MLQDVRDIQNKAIQEMLLQIESVNQQFTFKAPTGSGKTFMMAKFMDEFLAKHNDSVFIVSSLSKAKLAEQNYNKFIEYSNMGFIKHVQPFLINSEDSGENALFIPTDCNVYVLPRDLYKDKSKLKGQGAFKTFLLELKDNHKQIYLIKDECHIATSNLDELVESDKHNFFNKVINISATPKGKADVELLEEDAVNAKLIKSVKYRSSDKNFGDFEQGCIQYLSLDNALKEFRQIKEKYQNLKINPCFIIQISNKEQGEQQFNTIKELLNSPAHSDLKWMSIAQKASLCDTNDIAIKGNYKNWEKYVTKNESLIDVLIFKMMITEGWDIPRACMLFQIRDSQSKQLDEQVLGRVRRNPRLLDFDKLSREEQDLVTKAYVWGIKPKSVQDKTVEVTLKDISLPENILDATSIQNEIRLKITKLKDNLETIDKEFDVASFIRQQETKQSIANKSIFELYEELRNSNNRTQEECWKFVENHSSSRIEKYSDWFSFANNLGAIQNQIKTMLLSYKSSIELVCDDDNNPVEVSFPLQSVYIKNNDYQLQIGKWVWLNDDMYSNFSFDSEAEREWVHKLVNEECPDKIKDVRGILMIGKNFLPNSEIRYQYYDDGLHYSYPDVIMKSKRDEYFIFEVKSLNQSSKIKIDPETYNMKVQALKDFYLQVSAVIPEYYFCLPIKVGESWNVDCFKAGKPKHLGLSDFKALL